MTEFYNGINIGSIVEGISGNTIPSRSAPVKKLDGQIIAGGSTAEFTMSGPELEGYSAVVVTVRASYDASATDGARVRWLYSQDGSNYDSVSDAEDAGNYEDLSFTAGGTAQRTVVVPILAPYVKVQVVNKDGSHALTADAWALLMR